MYLKYPFNLIMDISVAWLRQSGDLYFYRKMNFIQAEKWGFFQNLIYLIIFF
jgi:hypothetical protein